jgi:type I restriction enzyme S subunit
MEFNNALKREIPIGWNSTELGKIADLYQPKTISEKEMSKDGKYLVYGANGIVGKYEQFNHAESVVAITCRGNTCGAINITRPYSWITGNAMVVKPLDDNISIDYLVNTLKRSGLNKIITGSAQPQITRSNLSPLLIISPPNNLIHEYAVRISGVCSQRK